MIATAFALTLWSLSVSGPGEAAEAVATGDHLYAQGDFAEAAAQFALAYEEQPQPSTLYRWAQAERRAGNCAVAVELYRKYLRTPDLAPDNVDAASKNLARCGHAAQPEPARRPRPDTPPPPTPGNTRDDPKPRRAMDPLAVGLVAGGGVGVVTSIVLGIQAEAQRRRAQDAATEDDYVSHRERAKSLTTAAAVVGSVGSAVLVGGLVRYVVRRRRDGQDASARRR